MDNAFTRAAAAISNDPNLSVAAVYGLPGGAALQVRVVVLSQDREGLVNRDELDLSVTTFELLMAYVPEEPVQAVGNEATTGCTISIGSQTWSIYDVSPSIQKASWLMTGRLI